MTDDKCTSWIERIRCPQCGHVQDAEVWRPYRNCWPVYAKICEQCDYAIIESEWQQVNTNQGEYTMDAIEQMRQAVKNHQTHDSNAFIPMTEAQMYAAVAQAEALTRIADVLEMAASDGIRIERERGE